MSRDVHYFAKDGSYGHAEGIEIIETEKWTEDDWDLIAETADSARAEFAVDITRWIRLGRPDDYWTMDYNVTSKYADPPTLF